MTNIPKTKIHWMTERHSIKQTKDQTTKMDFIYAINRTIYHFCFLTEKNEKKKRNNLIF